MASARPSATPAGGDSCPRRDFLDLKLPGVALPACDEGETGSVGDDAGMQIAILLFDGITALDAIGPYEALWRVEHYQVEFVAADAGLKRTRHGLGLQADRSLDEVPAPQILVIPGGAGVDEQIGDPRVLRWIRQAHQTTRWTTSVCTGALLLGAAGMLE